MAVIIGSATLVTTTLFPQGGIVSVNFGYRANLNRLWELGSWVPYDSYVQYQRELSVTAYGQKEDGSGGSQVFSLPANTTCADASSVTIEVTPGACGVSLAPFTDTFFPSSYSYSKDNFGWGQESWSFASKPDIDNYTGTIYMLRGISTGQMNTNSVSQGLTGQMEPADMGVVVNDASSRDSQGNYIEGYSASVSAGFPGIGDYALQREIVVDSVGGSIGKDDGKRGQASVTIPMNPVFL